MGDSPAQGELFVDGAPLGRVKSGSCHPETVPPFTESLGALLLQDLHVQRPEDPLPHFTGFV